jgi:hypothetical protein
MSPSTTDHGYGTLPDEDSLGDDLGNNHVARTRNNRFKYGVAALFILLGTTLALRSAWRNRNRLPHYDDYEIVIFNNKGNESKSSKLPAWDVLPWKLVVNKTESEKDYYVGYLQVCNDGSGKPFSYRAVWDAVSASPCDDIRHSPLIRMLPGKHYKLILINNAQEPTNLHTHGLHISGVGSVDDITRNVDPGSCLVYQYHILDTADVGTERTF